MGFADLPERKERVMDDMISRQTAIDAMCDNCDNVKAVCSHYPCKRYTAINALPSAQRNGKWIDQKDGGCCCSECGGYALDEIDGNYIHVASKTNYCPHCGARM